MTQDRRKIGRWGEDKAAAYLEGRGYHIIARNLHVPPGEIDIIASRAASGAPSLVFVEVKTRSSQAYGFPEESFSRKKYHKLLDAIQRYLAGIPQLPSDWQIDVIAVLGQPGDSDPEITHFEAVVMPDDQE